jgi:hypothetical protein
MKTTVNKYDFVRAFETCGRKDQFSTNALFALFDYLENYEEDCGVELELDPIGICCEWAEYPSAKEAAKEYGFVWKNTVLTREEASIEWLREQTQVVEFDGGIVIQLF